MHDCAYF